MTEVKKVTLPCLLEGFMSGAESMSCRDNESAGEEANAYLCRVSAAQPGSRSLWSTIITPLSLLECHACFDMECRFSPATQKKHVRIAGRTFHSASLLWSKIHKTSHIQRTPQSKQASYKRYLKHRHRTTIEGQKGGLSAPGSHQLRTAQQDRQHNNNNNNSTTLPTSNRAPFKASSHRKPRTANMRS